MNDEELMELNQELAKRMGWTLINDWWCIKAKDFPDSYFDHLFHIDDWHPAWDIGQAFEIDAWLQKYGWRLSLIYTKRLPEGCWWATYRTEYAYAHDAEANDHALAICLAAREVMMSMENK